MITNKKVRLFGASVELDEAERGDQGKIGLKEIRKADILNGLDT